MIAVSWNVHRARGRDGRVDPGRVARAIEDDVVVPGTELLVLNEADGETRPYPGLLDLGRIAAATGLRHAHEGTDLRWGEASDGFLGTVVMLHPSWTVGRGALLDLPGRCPRGAVVLEAARGESRLRIVATHLGLSQPLRIAQLRVVGQYLARMPAMPTVLLGDLNEWRGWGGWALSPAILGARFRGPARATFPVRFPVLPLDRILGAGGVTVGQATVPDGGAIRAASDHLPIRARLNVAPQFG